LKSLVEVTPAASGFVTTVALTAAMMENLEANIGYSFNFKHTLRVTVRICS